MLLLIKQKLIKRSKEIEFMVMLPHSGGGAHQFKCEGFMQFTIDKYLAQPASKKEKSRLL